jgi:hypothetical protein
MQIKTLEYKNDGGVLEISASLQVHYLSITTQSRDL